MVEILPHMLSELEAEYVAVRTHAGYLRRSRGVLRLSGREGADFLQRLSTNDMAPLGAGSQVVTILTTEKAKILDLCTVIPDGDALLIVTSDGMNENVMRWLKKYIIMEDIEIADITASAVCVSLFGAQAKTVTDSFFGEHRGGAAAGGTAGAPCILVREEGPAAPAYDLISPGGPPEAMLSSLLSAARTSGVLLQPVGAPAFDAFRVEQGLPTIGREITSEVNPLEASLRRHVSFTKGCYIGQEVIARIDTYGKLQKELKGLIIEAPRDAAMGPGVIRTAEGEIGATTSHSWSFALKRHVALGFVKTSFEGTNVEFHPAMGAGHPARISGFPLC